MDNKLTNEEKLNAIYEMTVENNEVLRSIRRQQYIGNAFRLLYWIIILGAIGGVYYYLGPVINVFISNASKFQDFLSSFGGMTGQLPETKMLQQIIEGLQKSAGNVGN